MTSRSGRISVLTGWIAGAAFTVLAVWGCTPEDGGGAGAGQQQPATITVTGLRECPHDWEWEGDAGPRLIEANLTKVTRGAHHVPEYNDCQRFLVGTADAPAYDSLFAIFAAQPDPAALSPEVTGGLPDSAGADLEEDRAGRAAAVIWAEGDYDPLHIQRGFNCLALAWRPGQSNQWVAAMVPAATAADCTGERPVEGSGNLLVRVAPPISGAGSPAMLYPPVARWGFDEQHWVQYIVTKCGEAACYVGPPGFSVRPTPPLPSPTAPPGQRRVHQVALWHDAQRLATIPHPGATLAPTGLHGTVIPVPNLESYDAGSFANTWVPVAEVALSAHSNAYADKLNFGATTPGDLNRIDACQIVGGGACPGVPSTLDCTKEDALSGEHWRTRHVNAEDGTTRYFCVERYPLTQTGLRIPGTARWRWLADDETLWFRCMRGCCDIRP